MSDWGYMQLKFCDYPDSPHSHLPRHHHHHIQPRSNTPWYNWNQGFRDQGFRNPCWNQRHLSLQCTHSHWDCLGEWNTPITPTATVSKLVTGGSLSSWARRTKQDNYKNSTSTQQPKHQTQTQCKHNLTSIILSIYLSILSSPQIKPTNAKNFLALIAHCHSHNFYNSISCSHTHTAYCQKFPPHFLCWG